MIFGRARLRVIGGVETHVIDLDGIVSHQQMPTDQGDVPPYCGAIARNSAAAGSFYFPLSRLSGPLPCTTTKSSPPSMHMFFMK